MIIVQYGHSTGEVDRKLEHTDGAPVSVLDKWMSRGNYPKGQEGNEEDHKNLILPVVPMVISALHTY